MDQNEGVGGLGCLRPDNVHHVADMEKINFYRRRRADIFRS